MNIRIMAVALVCGGFMAIAGQPPTSVPEGRVGSMGLVAGSTIQTGVIEGWPESGPPFEFDAHVTVDSDIVAWWSINMLDPDRGWFYAYLPPTEVAHATGISDICEITDASTYTYTDWSVGPVEEGDFVLFRNLTTDYYAAFRVDDIYGPEPLLALADITWYLQGDGTPNFGPCGGCVDDADCDDGYACTNDACTDGLCSNAAVDCDDGDECTDDSCDPVDGCVNTPFDCNDGDACTEDACVAGTCVHLKIDCGDGDECTIVYCDGVDGCVNDEVNCDDGNACTDDGCDPASGCTHDDNNDMCDDGTLCTTGDTCSGGSCIGDAVECPDGEFCVPGTGECQPPSTWYVDDDGDTKNGCTSWDDACPELQTALSLGDPGDEIWVAEGTYTPAGPGGDRIATFQLINGVGVYGGFDGTEPSLEERAGLFDETILSGDLNGDDDTDGDNNENSYHVTTGSGTNDTAILDGFTITAGNANASSFPNANGGGMLNGCGSPMVTNCTFSGNNAGNGGGMYNFFSSSPTVTNCTFSGNTTTFFGGGMFNDISTSPTVTNCTFSGNSADLGGGGMDNGPLSSPMVTNCTFSGNTAGSRGGGMGNSISSPKVINCTFNGNTAGSRGGGMSNNQSSSPTVTNCTFNGNTAEFGGGGMSNGSSTVLTVTNCTFSGNNAANGRALAFDSFRSPSDLSMSNCILWDGGGEVWNNDNSTINIAYSDVQGGWPGEGNVDADPQFVDPDGPDDDPDTFDDNDYRLSSGSPSIDAGDNTAVPEGIVTDLDGNPRFVDDPNTDDTGFGDPPIVDMGAYEFRDPCADDDGDGRVMICHIPPGNPDNARTITISINAVPAHLAHGDYCGPCEGGLSADLEAGMILGVQGEKDTRESVAPVLRERGP